MFEAGKARRRAWRTRGDDSNNLTVGNKNEETDNEENRNRGDNFQDGQGNDRKELKEEETAKEVIEATTVCRSMTSMFRRVLMFSNGVATDHYF